MRHSVPLYVISYSSCSSPSGKEPDADRISDVSVTSPIQLPPFYEDCSFLVFSATRVVFVQTFVSCDGYTLINAKVHNSDPIFGTIVFETKYHKKQVQFRQETAKNKCGKMEVDQSAMAFYGGTGPCPQNLSLPQVDPQFSYTRPVTTGVVAPQVV